MKKLTSKVVLALALAVAASTGVATDVNAASKKFTVKNNLTNSTAKTVNVAKGKKVKLTASSSIKKAATSKKSVATVKASGKTATVTAKKAGTAKVTLTAKNGKKATVKVNVKSGAVKSVKLNKTKTTIHLTGSYTLKATVKATSSKSNKTLRWAASNKNVSLKAGKTSAKVTAKKVGTATVTAYATDGSGKKAACKVTVDRKFTQFTFMEKEATATVSVTGAPAKLADDVNAAAALVLGDKEAQITVVVDGVDKVAEYKDGKVTVDGKDLSVVESKSGVVTVKVTKNVISAVKSMNAVAALAGDTYKDVVVEVAGHKFTNFKSTSKGGVSFKFDNKSYVGYTTNATLKIQGSATTLKAQLSKVAKVKTVYAQKSF